MNIDGRLCSSFMRVFLTVLVMSMKIEDVSKHHPTKNFNYYSILHDGPTTTILRNATALNTKPRPTKKIKRGNGDNKNEKKMPSRDKEKRLYEKDFRKSSVCENDISYTFTRINRSLVLLHPNQSNQTYTGVDEAGRGPLAGPVVAAAVPHTP